MPSAKYQRLKPGSDGPEVCLGHRLVKYAEVTAKLDAEKLRQEAEPGSPNSMASAGPCHETRSWHIYIPTRGRARTLRRKARERTQSS